MTERWVDQRHDQAVALLGVSLETTLDADQMGVMACGNAGRHFMLRRAVVADGAFVAFERDREWRLVRAVPIGLVDHPAGTFPQRVGGTRLAPVDICQRLVVE